MTASTLTLRLRDDDERRILDDLKRATRERTAAKALLRAAREYPELRAELAAARQDLANARAELRTIRDAHRHWRTTLAAQVSARDALDAALAEHR